MGRLGSSALVKIACIGVVGLAAASQAGCGLSDPGAGGGAPGTAAPGAEAIEGARPSARPSAGAPTSPTERVQRVDLEEHVTPVEPSAAPAGPPSPVCPDVASWPVRQQVAQTLFLGVDGSSDDEVRSLADAPEPVGGVFVRGEATTVFTSGILLEIGREPDAPLVAVDDEGGRVQRIDAIAGPLASARELGRLPTAQVRERAADRGRALRELGVTMDFAPVVDLGGQADGDVIGDRAFGVSAADVVPPAAAFARGLRDADVLPTLKHFPGHGRADGDSHEGPVLAPPWPDLLAADVSPYRALAADGKVAVMVGHVVVPGLSTDGLPASLDPAVYGALAEEVGDVALVVTDDLSRMRAVTGRFGQAEAARQALGAGADMVLLVVPADATGLIDGLEQDVAAGRLSAERVTEAATAVQVAKGCAPG